MATRSHETLVVPGYGADVSVIRWAGLLQGDDGGWITVPAHTDIVFHAFGTPGANPGISLDGSNEVVTPTSAIILNDSRGSGNAVTLTAAGIRQVLEAPVQVRPRVTGASDGTTTWTVICKFVRRSS